MGVMVFDVVRIDVPIKSHPVAAEARDHALRLAGYDNPAPYRNSRVRKYRLDKSGAFRRYEIFVRVGER